RRRLTTEGRRDSPEVAARGRWNGESGSGSRPCAIEHGRTFAAAVRLLRLTAEHCDFAHRAGALADVLGRRIVSLATPLGRASLAFLEVRSVADVESQGCTRLRLGRLGSLHGRARAPSE